MVEKLINNIRPLEVKWKVAIKSYNNFQLDYFFFGGNSTIIVFHTVHIHFLILSLNNLINLFSKVNYKNIYIDVELTLTGNSNHCG